MRNLYRQILLILSISILSTFAYGAVVQLAGHWVADAGTVSSNIGISGKCSKIEIIIEQTDSYVLTKKYTAECGMGNIMGSTWGPVRDDIKDGKIYEAGNEVGTIDATTMRTTAPDSGANYAYNLRIRTGSDGQPEMETYYATQNAVGAIAIEGILHKVNSRTDSK